MANTLLKVSGLKVAYGGIQAVKGVAFEVHEGELVSLIGANGAGKTTTLKAITGTQPAAAGEIEFLGKRSRGQGAWDLVRQGLVMVPEGRGVFARMTHHRKPADGRLRAQRQAEIDGRHRQGVRDLPAPEGTRNQLAGTMSGGEQQMLAMGRALMARPKVLLLDEPSMGLSPIMVDKIFEVVDDIHSQGMTVLLVEQNAEPRAAARGPRLRDGLGRDHDERRREGDAERPEGAGRLPRRVIRVRIAGAATALHGLAALLFFVAAVGARAAGGDGHVSPAYVRPEAGSLVILLPPKLTDPVLAPGAELLLQEVHRQLVAAGYGTGLVDEANHDVLWKQEVEAVGGVFDPGTGALRPDAYAAALGQLARRVAAETRCSLVLRPRLVLRKATLVGSKASWDQQERFQPVTGTFGSRARFDGGTVGLSVELLAIAPSGELQAVTFGGASLPFRNNMSTGKVELREDLFAAPQEIADGVQIALHPLIAR